MFAEISAAISSTRNALELVKAAHGLSNYNELVAAVSEVNSKLFAATAIALQSQEKQAALAAEIEELKNELANIRNWDAQAKNYFLQAVGVEQRHFVQVYKHCSSIVTAKHWACAKCFQERKLYILSAHERHSYICPNCEFKITPIAVGGALSSIESAYEQGP
ncbi:MAG TPA: hypothetical protein VLA61_27875 [Ideonella sp.]|uniref:hypothetical protein n=1 Tax=Ideonella sp. TaxID=1929293 RepID=UPI002D01DEFC|nr:hypothetical protein [Ideonella sp.]HSI52103.1 hypothetical protein [Ideonella sp.]